MLLFHFITDVPKHWSPKNNNIIRMAGKRLFCGKQQALINDRNYLILQMRQAWGGKPSLKEYIHAEFKFYFTNFYTKKGEMNLKLGDLSNIIQHPEDCLTKAGVILDDAIIRSYDGSRKLPSDTGQNYLEVILRAFDS